MFKLFFFLKGSESQSRLVMCNSDELVEPYYVCKQDYIAELVELVKISELLLCSLFLNIAKGNYALCLLHAVVRWIYLYYLAIYFF